MQSRESVLVYECEAVGRSWCTTLHSGPAETVDGALLRPVNRWISPHSPGTGRSGAGHPDLAGRDAELPNGIHTLLDPHDQFSGN